MSEINRFNYLGHKRPDGSLILYDDYLKMKNEFIKTLEIKAKIIAVMEHDLLLLGVNFDFDKVVGRYKQLRDKTNC